MSTEQQLEHAIKIEQFEGPFHALVEMLDSQKLNITEVALANVTDQYIKAVNTQGVVDPYSLADFLVVASRLLYLKSKTLLPMLVWEDDEEEAIDLEKQLKVYKKFYDAAQVIEKQIGERRYSYTRERMAIDIDVLFNPPHDLTTQKIQTVFEQVLEKLAPITRLPKKILKKTVSIRERMNNVREHILEKLTANFNDLLHTESGKSETIITFLAVLELVKQRVVHVEQDELHGNIAIHKKH